MRKFKFRCIVSGEKIVRKVVSIDYQNLKLAIKISGSMEWRSFDKIKDIMLYSSYSDIDDNLICQNDIVEYKGIKYKIVFSNMFVAFPIYLKRTDYENNYLGLLANKHRNIKIIGNIYENSDILKQEKEFKKKEGIPIEN